MIYIIFEKSDIILISDYITLYKLNCYTIHDDNHLISFNRLIYDKLSSNISK